MTSSFCRFDVWNRRNPYDRRIIALMATINLIVKFTWNPPEAG